MSATYLLQNEVNPSSFNSDPDNRDPLKINKHLQLDFFNVIGEPDTSSYNFEILHNASHQVYHYTKLGIYRILTILIGLPLMLCWGLIFGVYSFVMIWVAVPMRRISQSWIAETGLYVQTACDAIIGPLHRSMGQIFSNIRINLTKQNAEPAKTFQV